MNDLFITGGTGFVGEPILRLAVAAGWRVLALARSNESASRLDKLGAEPLLGSLEDGELIYRAVTSSQACVLAGAQLGGRMANLDEIATEAALRGCSDSGSCLIYTSGAAIYGDTGVEPADEDAPLRPHELVGFRLHIEQKIREAVRQGIRADVVRPGWVYGDGGGAPGLLASLARRHGAIVTIGRGDNVWSCVHRQDLAKLYFSALSRGGIGGQIWNAATAKPATQLAVANLVGRSQGFERRLIWSLDQAREKLGSYADLLAANMSVSSGRAMNVLGWKPSSNGVLDAWSS